MIKDSYKLTATEALRAFASGKLTSVELVKSCLGQITATDETIKAWAFLDPDAALAQAAECDRIRKAGLATGPLHGIPVGLKDIIDTAKMPTQRGTPIFAGRQTDDVARLVEHLREAGAVIMGRRLRPNWPLCTQMKPATRITLTTPPADHRADRPRRLRPFMFRLRSARRQTGLSSGQRLFAGPSGSNLHAV